ncbi:MAG: adenylyltransferase/cytidyltransferase family protein [Candidatus Aminicenantia bacterium]
MHSDKIKKLIELQKIVESLKDKGKRIVLANGCFDLIHVGHIRYLRDAKSKGDILIVALNSDKSVRALKGEGRPLMNELERAEILSSFEFVEYIVIFDEKDVSRVLIELKPHIHAKGSDYTEETVPERETVLSYGGKIAICGGEKVRSSSRIIENIKRK